MAHVYYVKGVPSTAKSMGIRDVEFTVVSPLSIDQLKESLVKHHWIIKTISQATRDQCESLPNFEAAIQFLKEEKERVHAHNEWLKEQAKKREEEEAKLKAERDRQQKIDLAEGRKRQLEEDRRRRQEGKERRERLSGITGGASAVEDDQVTDPRSLALIEGIIERTKLLLKSDHGDTLLEAICSSTVDIRVYLKDHPHIVAITNDLYQRLIEIVAGRKRQVQVSNAYQSEANTANHKINAISSRTYTYGGTVGIELLLAAWSADSQVKDDERAMRSIQRQVDQFGQEVQGEIDRIDRENMGKAVLIANYLQQLSYAIGAGERPSDMGDEDVAKALGGVS